MSKIVGFWYSMATDTSWYAVHYPSNKRKFGGRLEHKNSLEKADKLCFQENESIFGYKVGVYFSEKKRENKDKDTVTVVYDYQSQRELFRIDYSDPNDIKIIDPITSEGMGSYNFITFRKNQNV